MTRPAPSPGPTARMRRLRLIARRDQLRDAKQTVAAALLGRRALIGLSAKELRYTEKALELVEDAVRSLSGQIADIDDDLERVENVNGADEQVVGPVASPRG